MPLWMKWATHKDPRVLGLAEIRPNQWSNDQLDILAPLARRRDVNLAWTHYRVARESFQECMAIGRSAYKLQFQVRFFNPLEFTIAGRSQVPTCGFRCDRQRNERN